MPPDSDISELLLRWEESRQAGRALTPSELCPDHPEAAAELAQRIKAIEDMEQRLGQRTVTASPDPQLADGLDSLPTPPRAESIQIPGYEVLRMLDQGGMGIVYQARQLGLKRIVALKMLRADVHATPQQLARFKVEAEAVALLQHPNIVQIFEVGETGGRSYFTMEYVAGGSLADLIRRGPLPARDAAELTATLADAIHFAHERGIVHRDLKPANVLLAPPSDGQTARIPKIADFGLAKRLQGESQPSLTGEATQSGVILGTPSYMAPEQAAGRISQIGPQTDVYALGAVLYEMLAGKPPFKGSTPLETLMQVVGSEPSSPSRDHAPRDLETICLKCLEKHPAGRYASAAALADDLRRFLRGEPIAARHASLWVRTSKWAARRPESAALVALVLTVALGVGGYALWAAQHSKQAQREAAARLAPQAREILHRYCFDCHGHDGHTKEGQLAVLDYALLLDPARKLVIPGDTVESRLIHRIEDGSMPPEEAEEYPRLSSGELEALKQWVLGGAPAFPELPLPADVPTTPEALEVKEIFRAKCRECHRFGAAKNGIKILNHDLLTAKRKLVVPHKPDESLVYQSLFSRDPKKAMPPRDSEPLTLAEIETIRVWIESGAPPWPLAGSESPD